MAKLIVYSLFSIIFVINVKACSGKTSIECIDSDYPVCATNGTHWFLFKNQCRVNTENINREKHGVPKLHITQISNCFKQCDQICTNEHAPICAECEEKQKTFSNRCQLDLENCKSGNVWTILHEGECSAFSHPHEVPLPHPHGQTIVNPFPQQNDQSKSELLNQPLDHIVTKLHPHPEIQTQPPKHIQPLSYPQPQPNVQQLPSPNQQLQQIPHTSQYIYPQLTQDHSRTHHQLHPLSLPRFHLRPHTKPYTKSSLRPYSRPHSKPFPNPLIVNDHCPTFCSLEFDPICANFEGNEQTFQNQCYLKADMCRSKRAWVVKHNGECIEPEPQCDEGCPKIYSPVCATLNGKNKTFSNECILDLEICATKNQWDTLHYGECRNPIQDCPKICPDVFQPVCATLNGIQRGFPNECFAHMEACKTDKKWIIAHEGECEPVKLPQLPIPPPHHPCPNACPTLYDPICCVLRGTKRTFSNGCEINMEACKTGQHWKILFNGPCENEYEVQFRQPNVAVCSLRYEPICAALNGLRKTFTNKCQMDSEIAQTNHAWTIIGPGECETLPPHVRTPHNQPIFNHSPLTQPPLYQPPYTQPTFEQPPSNVPTLACPLCSDSYEPVCGIHNSEQQTFNNECLLISENCYSNKKWTVGYKGECHVVNTPRNCPNICPLNYNPVCATFNGVKRTFPNECELNHEAHRTNAQWVILSPGECNYCPNCSDDIAPVCAEFNSQTRTFDNACKVEAENCETKSGWKIVSRTSCGINNCPKICPRIFDPVCAIRNGETRTFGNFCEMKKEACNTNTVWNIISKGECPVPNENCPQSCSLVYNPVCAVFQGTSKKFINECFLRSEICKTHKNWEFVNAGPCLEHSKSQDNVNTHQGQVSESIAPSPMPKTELKCQISQCLTFRDPVCAAFNGEEKTFSNACYLNNTKCRTGEDWKIIRYGSCRKTTPRRIFWSPTIQVYETDEYIETAIL